MDAADPKFLFGYMCTNDTNTQCSLGSIYQNSEAILGKACGIIQEKLMMELRRLHEIQMENFYTNDFLKVSINSMQMIFSKHQWLLIDNHS